MVECVRAGCSRPVLADWWLLCRECSGLLLHLDDGSLLSEDDQRAAATLDALGWAERIAPACWGGANENDPWVLTVRTLAMAAVVTRRVSGCPHTVGSSASVPVVAVVRVPGVLRCPPCAEPVVAQASMAGTSCDRCGVVTGVTERVAALAGASLILVAELCPGCRSQALELVDDAGRAWLDDG